MKWGLFGKKKSEVPPRSAEAPEPQRQALEMLLERDCTRDQFFLLYFKLLQERMPGSVLTMLGDSVVGIVDASGKEATSYMDNIWLVYSQNKEDRREAIERYIRGVTTLTEERAAPARESIIAIIKDSQYMALFSSENMAIHQHLCGDLWIVYAEDLPESTGSLSRERMESAKVLEAELPELARENLQRILPDAERHGDGPWYLITAGGDYTASLLLFDGLWAELADSVDGAIVAVVPSRDALLYTGSNSPDGIAVIRERAKEIVATGDHVVSETLIVRTGGKWEVFNAN